MSSTSTPTFTTCWLAALSNDRGAWTLLSASILMVYGYALSNRKFLWNLLLVNGIAGCLGIILQTCYKAVNIDSNMLSDSNRGCTQLMPGVKMSVILGVNEIFWFLNETSTVLYSFFKVETVTSVTLPRKVGLVLRGIMGTFCLAYLPMRIYIGYLRASQDSYWNHDIEVAHGFAFITWGLAEIFIICMLVQAAIYARKGRQSFGSVITTVCSSSILRLLIIGINQVMIAFYAIVPKQKIPGTDTETESSRNFSDVLWLIRGIYPMIMLFDILSTQSLLIERTNKSTERSHNTGYQTYDFPDESQTPYPQSQAYQMESQIPDIRTSQAPVNSWKK